MKHSNNMREKVSRTDNAGAVAKKAAEEKRVTSRSENKNDRIEIGNGVAHAGVGGSHTVGPIERMAPFESTKESKEEGKAEEEVENAPKKSGTSKSSWIKGSSESKKLGGSHSVKGKL
jgi:hypothetical protein